MAGRVDFFFMAIGAALPQIREGKLVALAVNGGQRSAALPNVPTLDEAGFRNAEYPTWMGLFVPARTPREIVERLRQETTQALQDPKVSDRLTALGVDPMVMQPVEFEAFVQKQIAADAVLVRTIGLKTQP